MKTSEVFKRVKVHLEMGGCMAHHHYICYALNELYLRGYIPDVKRTKCKRIVLNLLKPCDSLNEWLIANHSIHIEHTEAYHHKMKVTRLAWLDHLINHYEAKGD
jgi:hypothetical protein